MVFSTFIQMGIALEKLGIVNVSFQANHVGAIITGTLCLIMGIPMRKVKRNGLFGVRTPWSMKNEEAWERSNTFGSTLMIVIGLTFYLYAFIIPAEYMGFAIVGTLLIGVLIVIVASYHFYKKSITGTNND